MFIIGAEVFPRAINKAIEEETLSGIKPPKTEKALSHLDFVDDYPVFVKTNVVETKKLAVIFQDYCKLSKQMVNVRKSNVIFERSIRLGHKMRSYYDQGLRFRRKP